MPARLATPPGKNPAAAGLLSLFPGLGHVYLGLYKRGIVFFAIFVMLIAIADRGDSGPFGMLIPFWVIFVLIDAVRQARAINATGMPEPGFFGEEKPFDVLTRHVEYADTRHGVGVADLARIKILKLGWMEGLYLPA